MVNRTASIDGIIKSNLRRENNPSEWFLIKSERGHPVRICGLSYADRMSALLCSIDRVKLFVYLVVAAYAKKLNGLVIVCLNKNKAQIASRRNGSSS